MADIDTTIASWQFVVDQYITHRNITMSENPAWRSSDIRLAIYALPANVLVSGLLTMKMLKTGLLRTDWWDLNCPALGELAKRQYQTDEFVTHAKMGNYILFFSMFEASVRHCYRALKPGAYDKSTDAFSKVYSSLFAEVGISGGKDLLDFASAIRNLIHNNGHFMSKRQPRLRMRFLGENYLFEHGKQPTFIYQELLLNIYLRVLDVTHQLVRTPSILRMPESKIP